MQIQRFCTIFSLNHYDRFNDNTTVCVHLWTSFLLSHSKVQWTGFTEGNPTKNLQYSQLGSIGSWHNVTCVLSKMYVCDFRSILGGCTYKYRPLNDRLRDFSVMRVFSSTFFPLCLFTNLANVLCLLNLQLIFVSNEANKKWLPVPRKSPSAE